MVDCTIMIEGLPYELIVDEYSISIVCNKKTDPKSLANAYMETRNLLATTPGMMLLIE